MKYSEHFCVATLPINIKGQCKRKKHSAISAESFLHELKRVYKIGKELSAIATALAKGHANGRCKFRPELLPNFTGRISTPFNIGICVEMPIEQQELLSTDMISEIQRILRDILIDAKRCIEESKDYRRINIECNIISEINKTDHDKNIVIADNMLSENTAFFLMKNQKIIGSSFICEFNDHPKIEINPSGSFFVSPEYSKPTVVNVLVGAASHKDNNILLINKGGSDIISRPFFTADLNENIDLQLATTAMLIKIKNKKSTQNNQNPQF